MGMLSSYIYFLFFSLLALNIQQIKNNSEKGNFPKQTASLGVEYCAHFHYVIVIEKGT